MLELNASLFGIALLVIILLITLNKIYYNPIARILDEREEKINGISSSIEAKSEEIESIMVDIEKSLKDAHRESREIKEELIKKGENVREKMRANAQIQGKELLESKMKQLDDELSVAEQKLEREIGEFSNQIKRIFLD
ncbi:MAG: ATP synthase F0 subunit B [Candidatus Omnitrophota bacterium]